MQLRTIGLSGPFKGLPILMLVALLYSRLATANMIVITVGSGPGDMATAGGSFVGGVSGGPTGNIPVAAGMTAAATAAALAAATGGVNAPGTNTVTYNGATGGGAIMDAGLFGNLHVQKILEPVPPPQPPPNVNPPLPQPPPNNVFIDVFNGPVILIGGVIQKVVTLSNLTGNIFTANITVPFTAGESTSQLDNAIFAAFTPFESQLPANVSLTQVNGEPSLSGASLYGFSDQDILTMNSAGNAGFGVGSVGASPTIPEPGTVVGGLLGVLLIVLSGCRPGSEVKMNRRFNVRLFL